MFTTDAVTSLNPVMMVTMEDQIALNPLLSVSSLLTTCVKKLGYFPRLERIVSSWPHSQGEKRDPGNEVKSARSLALTRFELTEFARRGLGARLPDQLNG